MKQMLYVVLAALFAAAPAGAQMAPPIPMTPAQFSSAVSGANVTLVLRVATYSRSTLDGELLERESDSRYKQSGKNVELYLPPETPFVMGSASDLKAQAVIFVYAVATTPGHADVKKVVVVTPYVTVE